jgi:hypothetical protein
MLSHIEAVDFSVAPLSEKEVADINRIVSSLYELDDVHPLLAHYTVYTYITGNIPF